MTTSAAQCCERACEPRQLHVAANSHGMPGPAISPISSRRLPLRTLAVNMTLPYLSGCWLLPSVYAVRWRRAPVGTRDPRHATRDAVISRAARRRSQWVWPKWPFWMTPWTPTVRSTTWVTSKFAAADR